MKTSGCRKSPSAHMQARGDKEGRDAVEGGEDMKSTKRFKAALAAVLVLALSPLFGGAAFAEDSSATTYSGNKTAVTDPSTIWDWQGLVENDTSSVGRIWTDKTVSDGEISKNGVTISKENGADFLTALTALSSTSNLSDTATTPLDIVLVLDASGSMDDPMGGGDTTKRIDALKSAANSFIDEIVKQNATVKDAAKQHQVSIVKFAGTKTESVGNDRYRDGGHWYNYSQVMKTLAPCTNDTKSDFSSQVNAIKPAGATNAAAGLELAKGQTSGRSDAKKVVIFFTDGTPTDYSDFSPDVASSAVGYAKDMKDAGAAVYSIGIFKGVDPAKYPDGQGVSNENKFMHAVSSNYPSATYSYESTSWWSGEYIWNFGDRAKGSDGKDATFYKSATNADELKHVFDDISKEISKGSGYPTKTSEGFEHETGYITFDDQLGDYMQVTDLSKLVYNGTVYGCKSKTTDGNVDTYHFSGDVHSGLAAADLKDVVITVTRSNDAAVGDKVQVKVPASLIPLRNFAIDLAKDTMSVSNTTPISVLYSSGVKPAALDLLESPDDAMKAYMEKSTDPATGKVNFYANKWTGNETGDAVATFQPATGNNYYYFRQDTPIYADEACTVPAKSVESGSTYYYKHSYYAMENGKPVAKTEHVSFPGNAAEKVEGAIGKDPTGACYLKSGTPRLTYVNELHKAKEENRTATAKDVLNPKWSGVEQSSAETLINAYLGNNGKLSVDVPGTLTVTKQLKLPDGYNADDFANDSFEFTIAMQDAVGKNFNAVVKNANGQQQGDKFVLAFGQDGQAKHSLKPGETLYVYGLSAGWDYKVSETPRAGFTAEAAGAEGKIAAGETSAVTYTNTYTASGTLDGETYLKGEKVLTGRDMAEGETFGFKLSAANGATQNAKVAGNIVISQGADEAVVSGAKAGAETPFSFGEMTFKKPGTYSFAVQEDKYCGNNLDEVGTATGGIVFDRHVHKVTVTVTDDHKGKLVAEVSYDNGPAKFENKYEQNAQFSGITVQKTLNGRDMAADEFSFSIHGVDKEGAVAATEAEARLADSDRSFTNAARADGIACDMAKMNGVAFTQADIGKTFAYEVREVVPAEGDRKPGVTYDDGVHTLEITVGMSSDADKHLTLTTKLDGKVVDSATKLVAVAFVNGYQATPTSYDTATAGLNKVLEGRNWTDADNFTFELKALDGGPLPKDAAGNDVTNVTVTKANAESFGFGAIEFTSDMVKAEPDHKRTFAYEVREVVPADGHKLPGIHYDDNVATIKVTVSDDGSGMLKASAVAENIRFVNRYAAEIDYTAAGGLNVAKTLTGRDMAEGQFTIKVTPGDEASAYALGLPLEGAEIAMPAAADGAQAVKSALGEQHVVLRQSDVGKTYTYKVTEVQAAADGYTYDTTEYTVTVMAWDDPQKAALTVTTEVAGPEGIKTYVYGADPSAAGTGPAVVPFANAYAASTDNPGGTAAQVTATKALTGRPLSAGEFTFAVKYATGGDDLRTAENAADGTVTFYGLHYTTEMLEGLVKDGNAYKTSDQGVISWTVSYLAYEKTDGLAGQGVTPQTQPIPFTVTVVDNGDGSLTATANLDKGLKFENTYSTGDPVQVGLSGVKMLQAAPGLAPASIEGKFTFTVTSDDAAAPMPERTTAKNAADGSVDFGTIEFTLDDLNRALGVNDQTAIANADKAEADVAKAADQAAAPAKEADADADASRAAADADKAAAGADNASAKAADEGDKPVAADQGDKPAAGDGQGAGAVAASDAASGTVDKVAPGNQPASPEPESGKPRSHVFTYKVTESGSVPGVINDAAATKTVSFKVTDDGAGKLTVERQGDAATPAFSFANTYTVEPASSSVTDQVTVTKTLTGRDMAAGEFAFELLEGEDVVATGANAADGSVTLNAVKYTQPGTHRYTLHEVGGGTVANGVTYDGATYTVVTTVKDNGDGTLSVTHALEGAREAAFANAYQATSTTVIIGATKTLVGKNLENGQFTFVLTAADGTELKAKNAADGKIAFPALTFDKPGTYEFALTELDDAQANVTYDKRAYKATVTVVDDGLGHLNATVAGDADVLAFTNTYAEPPAPVQPTQPGGKTFTPRGPIGKVLTQTGDDKLALVLPLAAVALAGAASIAALLIMRRRDKR